MGGRTVNNGTILMSLGVVLSTLITAFFTGAETSLISCDRIFLGKKRREGSRQAAMALRHLENIDRLLSTTQLGANLGIAMGTTLATLLLHRTGVEHEWILMLGLAPLILIFSDSVPKVIGRSFPEKLSLTVAAPLSLFSKVLSPALLLLSLYTNRLSRIAGLGRQDALSRRKKAREELHALLAEPDSDSDIRLGHKRMIRKILEFSQHTVKKVMLPFVNVDAIEKGLTVQDAINTFETLRHSRLPVYEERIDNIVGILYFPDVFHCRDPDNESVSRYMRPAKFVPAVQQLDTLAKELQESEMAVVVDEYGGAVGIVTKEDVLEEIVGDISDEWDENNLGIMEMGKDTYLVHVTMGVVELNERLGIHVPKGEYETLSGFLLQQFNRIPTVGDELYFSNFKIRVHRANEKVIETVIIQVHRTENADLDKDE
jgi:CBS domain containing-hemolysin-like protein